MCLPACLSELAFWEWTYPGRVSPAVELSDPQMEAGGLLRRSEDLLLSCCCSFLTTPCQKFRMARCPPTVCPMASPMACIFTAMASGCQRLGGMSGKSSLTWGTEASGMWLVVPMPPLLGGTPVVLQLKLWSLGASSWGQDPGASSS